MQLKTNYNFRLIFLLGLLSLAACNKKVSTPGPLDPSPNGNLGRYDLATDDYDVLPVTTFVFSYDKSNSITNVFEKSGQTLIAYAMNGRPLDIPHGASYGRVEIADSAGNRAWTNPLWVE